MEAQELLYTAARKDGSGPDSDVQLLVALERVSGQYHIEDFEVEALKQHLGEDIE
ncbi:unnamed protein product [marine sediment metagenome]|uniref:Uncharacterized protein n=1 Tax=marine sediment metagenome TaxID=412755 RepID=X1PDH0_9ZZZZ